MKPHQPRVSTAGQPGFRHGRHLRQQRAAGGGGDRQRPQLAALHMAHGGGDGDEAIAHLAGDEAGELRPAAAIADQGHRHAAGELELHRGQMGRRADAAMRDAEAAGLGAGFRQHIRDAPGRRIRMGQQQRRGGHGEAERAEVTFGVIGQASPAAARGSAPGRCRRCRWWSHPAPRSPPPGCRGPGAAAAILHQEGLAGKFGGALGQDAGDDVADSARPIGHDDADRAARPSRPGAGPWAVAARAIAAAGMAPRRARRCIASALQPDIGDAGDLAPLGDLVPDEFRRIPPACRGRRCRPAR